MDTGANKAKAFNEFLDTLDLELVKNLSQESYSLLAECEQLKHSRPTSALRCKEATAIPHTNLK